MFPTGKMFQNNSIFQSSVVTTTLSQSPTVSTTETSKLSLFPTVSTTTSSPVQVDLLTKLSEEISAEKIKINEKFQQDIIQLKMKYPFIEATQSKASIEQLSAIASPNDGFKQTMEYREKYQALEQKYRRDIAELDNLFLQKSLELRSQFDSIK